MENRPPARHLLGYNKAVHDVLGPERQLSLGILLKNPSLSCPLCQYPASHGLGASMFFCTQLYCVNPPMGYCVQCREAYEPGHRCPRADLMAELAKIKLYSEQPLAIMPCPRCNTMFEKLDECNHMRCGVPTCKRVPTDEVTTRFCGSCRANLDRGTDHRCNSNNIYILNHTAIMRFYRELYLQRCAEAGVQPL